LDGRIAASTGLRLDPYFTGSKALWLAENEPATWAGLANPSNPAAELVIGTIDSYLISRMSAGRSHVTDATNASRTLLFDINTGAWSDELLDLFKVPRAALPEVVASYGKCGEADPGAFLGLALPIAGIAGDQQAALVGQSGLNAGDSKCTYGTGSFILTNTGSNIVRSNAGLLTTVALGLPDGSLTYALEGAVFVTGSAVQWLRDGLGLINKASDIEALACQVESSDGVVFVPALTGLGAPHWDSYARGTIVGITRGTTKAHIALATLEAIAYQVRDVVDLMAIEAHTAATATPAAPAAAPSRTSPLETPLKLKTPLKVDGGAAANDLLMQLQADVLQREVVRSAVLESTGMGAAYLAGLGVGVWQDFSQVKDAWQSSGTFKPLKNREGDYQLWLEAVNRSKNWAHPS
jgi:glycerol kinase